MRQANRIRDDAESEKDQEVAIDSVASSEPDAAQQSSELETKQARPKEEPEGDEALTLADEPGADDLSAKTAVSPGPEDEVSRGSQVATSQIAHDSEPKSETESVALLPIEERVPEEPLSDEERRKWVAENLKKLADALFAYHQDHGRLPKSYGTANGFRTVSWRVELLPYLGYDALYARFDTGVPWNKPPNDEMLRFIPPEFTSPERFDTTSNIVMPSGDGMISGSQLNETIIEDGIANTLLLVEASDDHAVPWTSPQDFEPRDYSEVRAALNGPREEGTFGVWANGWTVLLSRDVSGKYLKDAMTIDAGDGLRAGRIHRDIPLAKVSEASVTPAEEEANSSQAVSSVTASAGPPSSAAELLVREPVPSASEVDEVQARFRSVYHQRISDARTDDQKSNLAGEMLDEAAAMENDPAGAYVLQKAAMSLAIDAGDVQQLVRAIDQRVGRFEVDAYTENLTAMQAFGRGVAQRDPRTIDGVDYLKRAVHVVFTGVHSDDYVESSTLVRYAYRLLDQQRDEKLPRMLNRLRGLLGAAKRDYDAAADSLSNYRLNPDDGDAAADIGRFLCFIKGDWQRGLPLLTEGGPDMLREIARMDLQGAEDHLQQVRLGDTWWDLSEQARTQVYRQSARDRAVYWYEQAFAVMPESLDRLHVRNRLDEAADAPPSSPLALIQALAEEAGVRLEVSLTGLATGQQHRQQDEVEDD